MRSLTILFLIPVAVLAQGRTHDITPDDYFTLNTITEIAVSPDGSQVAYILSTWDKAEDNRKTDLWVVAAGGRAKPVRLTFDRANDRHPKWSEDGKSIYFLGNRKREAEKKPPFDGTTQIWRIAADGSGEPRAITRDAGGVTGFDYAHIADAIFYSKDKDHADQDDFAKLRSTYKADYGHGKRKVSEIHKLDLATWQSRKLVDETRYIREFTVAAKGDRIAMITAFDDTVVKSEGESRVDIFDVYKEGLNETGKVTTPSTEVYRAKASSPYAWLDNLCMNEKGSGIAFTAVHDGYPAEVILFLETNDSNWKTRRVDRDGEWEVVGYGRSLGQSMKWGGDDSLWFMAESEGVASLRNIVNPSEGDKSLLKASAVGTFDLQTHVEGLCTVLNPTFDFPQLSPGGRSFNLNPHTKTWRLPTIKHIKWKAPDGSNVGGVLELPYGYKEGDKLPLVVAIHGGPTTSTKAEMTFDPHNGRLYFAAAGYAVLLPNYRGSTGYGDKFVTDLIGHENDIEVKDIIAGIQHLVKEGIADENRVGVMGWSNGGYLTNCLITLKDSPIKFKAASSGAGIVDTVSEWGFNDEPGYPIVFKKGLPWEQPEVYRKTSPTYQLGNVKTPTLIHVGGGDERCPPGHSRMLYRALKENLNVPTELVVYPGEPHGLTKYSNRKAKMEWDLAWFDKYLKNAK